MTIEEAKDSLSLGKKKDAAGGLSFGKDGIHEDNEQDEPCRNLKLRPQYHLQRNSARNTVFLCAPFTATETSFANLQKKPFPML